MSLQEAAEARKQKLLALRKRKHESGAPQEAENGEHKQVFKFRNYDPETGTMKKHARTDEEDTVEKQVEGLAEKVIAEDEAKRAQELDLTNIQPKRANWDLKRDLDRKLAKLKTRTDIAISTLIRKRLQAQKGGDAAAASLVAGFGGAGTGGEQQGLPGAESDSDEE